MGCRIRGAPLGLRHESERHAVGNRGWLAVSLFARADFCTLYIDTRLLPWHAPLEVQREIEAVVAKLRRRDPDLAALRYDISMFMNQWASECPPGEYIWKVVAQAHQEVVGSPVEISARPPASDAGELVAHGIPSLNYGVSGRMRARTSGIRNYGKTDWSPAEGEHASIEDLFTGTKVYANLILEICNRTRQELGIKPREQTHAH